MRVLSLCDELWMPRLGAERNTDREPVHKHKPIARRALPVGRVPELPPKLGTGLSVRPDSGRTYWVLRVP